MLLRAILSGCVWNLFLLGKSQGADIALDGDGHLFWECLFPLGTCNGQCCLPLCDGA